MPTKMVSNAPEVNQTSNYYDQESLAGVFITNINSFNIFSLNCQSINAKIDEIKIKRMESVNCTFDATTMMRLLANAS